MTAEPVQPAPFDQRLSDSVDRSEISALIDRYADVVTRRTWAELHHIFLPTTVLELDLRTSTKTLNGPDEIAAMISTACERFEFFQFLVLGVTIELGSPRQGSGRRAAARTYMSEIRQTVVGHQWSQIYGIYHDTFEFGVDAWRFDRRRYQTLARRTDSEVLSNAEEIFSFPHHLNLAALDQDESGQDAPTHE